jgi:hypothetical protein
MKGSPMGAFHVISVQRQHLGSAPAGACSVPGAVVQPHQCRRCIVAQGGGVGMEGITRLIQRRRYLTVGRH